MVRDLRLGIRHHRQPLLKHQPHLRELLFAFWPGPRAAQLAQLLGDLQAGVGVKEEELLVHRPAGVLRVGVEENLLQV